MQKNLRARNKFWPSQTRSLQKRELHSPTPFLFCFMKLSSHKKTIVIVALIIFGALISAHTARALGTQQNLFGNGNLVTPGNAINTNGSIFGNSGPVISNTGQVI